MRLPEKHNTIQSDIDKKIESRKDSHRYHLGVSQIGEPCDRRLWLSFRGALEQNFNGRMLRLFRRGQNEEQTAIDDLRLIGCVVDGQQTHVKFTDHVSGSCDGIIESGLPGAEKTQHVLEIKTHNDKSFKDLKNKGVEKSKPQHYIQMQCYMLGLRIDRALYFAVNKNDDEYYTERIKFDGKLAESYINRGIRITMEDRIPPKAYDKPDWYICKMCNFWGYCYSNTMEIKEHCRTCEYSECYDTGWYCQEWSSFIPKENQFLGCKKYCRMFGL